MEWNLMLLALLGIERKRFALPVNRKPEKERKATITYWGRPDNEEVLAS
jgi:hypothetical protein